MNLRIIKGTETMVNAPVTPEQAHYILNYLGHTYVDTTTEEVEEEPKRRGVDDIKDITVTMNGKTITHMDRLIVGNLNWEANTYYDASTDLLASMIKCYREDTMGTQEEGLALAFSVIDYFSEFDTVWDIEPTKAIEVIRDFLDYVRREL